MTTTYIVKQRMCELYLSEYTDRYLHWSKYRSTALVLDYETAETIAIDTVGVVLSRHEHLGDE